MDENITFPLSTTDRPFRLRCLQTSVRPPGASLHLRRVLHHQHATQVETSEHLALQPTRFSGRRRCFCAPVSDTLGRKQAANFDYNHQTIHLAERPFRRDSPLDSALAYLPSA